MARSKQSKGKCSFCEKEMTKGGLSRHLKSCPARQEAVAAASNNKRAKEEILYHLVVQDAYNSSFWLHLEMQGTATLAHLDSYLRSIWLECCGHMSQFSFGGWRGDELTMDKKINDVFSLRSDALTHIYDFGSSSETKISANSSRNGTTLTKHPIYLMARNNEPNVPCMECGETANFLCMECAYETDETGFLCSKHETNHPHEDYGDPHHLLNTPRVGYCGEIMGDEPPY